MTGFNDVIRIVLMAFDEIRKKKFFFVGFFFLFYRNNLDWGIKIEVDVTNDDSIIKEKKPTLAMWNAQWDMQRIFTRILRTMQKLYPVLMW